MGCSERKTMEMRVVARETMEMHVVLRERQWRCVL